MAPIGRPSLPLLVAVLASSQLAVTIYLPSLPSMPAALDTSQTMVQLLVTVYLAAFAIAQLIVGPLSDAHGRRPVLLAGLSLFVVASAIASVAPTIEILLIARVFQAFGACSGFVIARAIIRDTSHGRAAAKAMAYLGMAMAVAPALAPVVGGQVHVLFGWRGNFYLIAAVSALVCFATYRLMPETLPREERRPSRPATLAGGYLGLLRMRAFMGYTANTAFQSGSFNAFLAASPIVLIAIYGVRPDLFGLYTIFLPLGFMLGNLISSRLPTRVPMDTVIRAASALGVVSCLAMILVIVADGPLIALMATLVVLAVTNGLVLPNCLAGALNAVEPNLAGTAAALGGFLQMALGTLSTAIVAAVVFRSALPMALLMTGAMTAGLLCFLWLAPRAAARVRQPLVRPGG